MKSFLIKEALQALDINGITYKFFGNENIEIVSAKSFIDLQSFSVSFYKFDDIPFIPNNVENCLLILNSAISIDMSPVINYIFSDDPTICFCIIASLLNEKKSRGIHPTAYVSTNAIIDKTVVVGPFSYVGDEVVIEKNTIIGANTVIDHACIGNNVVIYNGVKIGSPSFSSYKDKNGKWFEFPHFGKVLIGDNVEILDNSVICRGILNDTLIQRNVRIGGLVYISHGVVCEEGACISSGSTLAGSVKVKKGTVVWMHSAIRDKVVVEDDSVIGLGAVITKNIPSKEVWFGNPAKMIRKLED